MTMTVDTITARNFGLLDDSLSCNYFWCMLINHDQLCGCGETVPFKSMSYPAAEQVGRARGPLGSQSGVFG